MKSRSDRKCRLLPCSDGAAIIAEGSTPDPFPNSTVKASCADGTASSWRGRVGRCRPFSARKKDEAKRIPSVQSSVQSKATCLPCASSLPLSREMLSSSHFWTTKKRRGFVLHQIIKKKGRKRKKESSRGLCATTQAKDAVGRCHCVASVCVANGFKRCCSNFTLWRNLFCTVAKVSRKVSRIGNEDWARCSYGEDGEDRIGDRVSVAEGG